MAQAIIRVTPKSPGTLQVTVLDPTNPHNIQVGQILSFARPSFTVHEGDTVDCTILSGTAASVTRVLTPGS